MHKEFDKENKLQFKFWLEQLLGHELLTGNLKLAIVKIFNLPILRPVSCYFFPLFGLLLVLEYLASRSDRKLLKLFSLDFCRCWKNNDSIHYMKIKLTVPFINMYEHWIPAASSQGCCPAHSAPIPFAFPLLLLVLCQPGTSDPITRLQSVKPERY